MSLTRKSPMKRSGGIKPKKPTAKSAGWYKNLPERFWVKVNKDAPNGCWEWTGCLQSQGYGQFSYEGRATYTHRLAFFAKHGRWPENFACHTCDNRKCCNPDHLFEGTCKENSLDMLRKLRHRANRSLTENQVAEVRRLMNEGVCGGVIARRFGISKGTLCNIKNGRCYTGAMGGAR